MFCTSLKLCQPGYNYKIGKFGLKNDICFLLTAWLNISDSFYHFGIDEMMDWTSADQYCASLNAHLFRTETQVEYEMIKSIISENES